VTAPPPGPADPDRELESAIRQFVKDPALADLALAFAPQVDQAFEALTGSIAIGLGRRPSLARPAVAVVKAFIVSRTLQQLIAERGDAAVRRMSRQRFTEEMLAVHARELAADTTGSDWPRSSTDSVRADVGRLVEQLQPQGPLPDLLRFQADRIQHGAVEALAKSDAWAPVSDFDRALEVAYGGGFRMVVGYRGLDGDLWVGLRTRGPVAVKTHFALWARCFEQTGGDPDQYVRLSITQLCEDLGYKRHHKGGFRREHKQEVLRLVEALIPVELAVEFKIPGSRKVRRLRGPLWQRGTVAEERDEYGDLFGAAREGDPKLWDPVSISYRPGQWFQDPTWRRYNEYIGTVGAGLLKLDNLHDRWAILIGGYYASVARFGHYEPTRIGVDQILQHTGLGRRNRRNPGEQQEDFDRAHDRLVEVGVLMHWDYVGRAADWRDQEMELVWPAHPRMTSPVASELTATSKYSS
jgi:hypothetical protein